MLRIQPIALAVLVLTIPWGNARSQGYHYDYTPSDMSGGGPISGDVSIDGDLWVGDGTYSWDHTPQFGVEGISEFDGACYHDSDIYLENGTKISNSVAGNITIKGEGGAANKEDLTCDFETTPDTIGISSSTGVTTVDFGSIKVKSAGADMNGGDLENVGGASLTGNVSFNCNTCPCLIYQEAETTDAAACSMMVHAGDASPVSTGVNRVGAPLILRGGLGIRIITVDSATCTGDTVTITNGSLTPVVLTGGTSWACGANTTEGATNLAAAVALITGYAGTISSTNVVRIVPDASAYGAIFTVSDAGGGGAFATVTSGANGQIILSAQGSASVPALSLGADTDTGWFSNSDGYWQFSSNTAYRMAIGSTIDLLTPAVMGATYYYGFNGRSRIYSGADGYLTLTDDAGTSFNGLRFGGATSSYPMWSRSGAGFAAYVADGTALTTVTAGTVSVAAPKGAATSLKTSVQWAPFAGTPGNASKTTSGLCPADSIVTGITWRVSTAATNCTSVEIGDGTDADMFGTTQAITQGTTGKISNYTATSRVNAYSASGFEATVTANGGNCFGGVWRFTCHYTQLTADTAN